MASHGIAVGREAGGVERGNVGRESRQDFALAGKAGRELREPSRWISGSLSATSRAGSASTRLARQTVAWPPVPRRSCSSQGGPRAHRPRCRADRQRRRPGR